MMTDAVLSGWANSSVQARAERGTLAGARGGSRPFAPALYQFEYVQEETKMTQLNTFTIQAEKYAHDDLIRLKPRRLRHWSGANITTCKALFPWLYDYMAKLDVVDFNAALVDYAEYILKDPQPYGDDKWNREVRGGLSFLGHGLRQTHKTKAVRPYSAVLLELAASIHALGEVNDGAEHELACAMAFDLLDFRYSIFFETEREKGRTYLVGTPELKQQYHLSVKIEIAPELWTLSS
jgi:hypothetical protein